MLSHVARLCLGGRGNRPAFGRDGADVRGGSAGCLSLDDLRDAIRPTEDVHYVRTRLVCLENTHNRGGGRVHPIESIARLRGWAREHNLAMHLDGARLMNAVVASGTPGARVGTVLRHGLDLFFQGTGCPDRLGPRWFCTMRSGQLAGSASCSAARCARSGSSPPAHFTRSSITLIGSSEDHAHARILADAFTGTDGFALESGTGRDQPGLGLRRPVGRDRCRRGRLPAIARDSVSVPGSQVLRACTHLDVDRDQVEEAAGVIRQIEPAMISAMTLVY